MRRDLLMPRITISYRREDSGPITGRIFDRLVAHYGRDAVFRDIDNIPIGVDFREHINKMLDASDLVLAIVGPRWVGPRGQSRLTDDADPVRVEIEAALRKGVPLVPVLVLRGAMPRADQLPDSLKDFAYRNALQVDAAQDFDMHMSRLTRVMDRMLQTRAPGTAVLDDELLGGSVPEEVDQAAAEPQRPAAPAIGAPGVVPPAADLPKRRYALIGLLVLAAAILGGGAGVGFAFLWRPTSETAGSVSDPSASRVKALQDELATTRQQADQDRSRVAAELSASRAQLKTLWDQLAAEKEAHRSALAQIDQLAGETKKLRDKLAVSEPTAKPPAAAPAPATAPTEEAWSLDQRREIQRALRLLGHYGGEADGGFGAGTTAAIKQFQAYEGNSETGTISAAERQVLLQEAQRLAALLDQPPASPLGLAAASIKSKDQRYARAWNFDNGRGVRADPAEAAYWYALAAADGDARAFLNLGTLVARGRAGTAADPVSAKLLWQAAAARGEAIGMYDLGILYERGIGVTADRSKARTWYQRAADRNHADARAALRRLGPS